MKKILLVIGYGLLVVGLTGCARLQKVIKPAAKIDSAKGALPAYTGPKARIVVADFEVKATKATSEIGLGLREMLATALVNSNRFLATEPQVAELIITAAVAEFEPELSGGREGLGGGGGVGSGVFGGLLGVATNKAYMALDIRVMNTSTSEVLAASRIQGQASSVAQAVLGELSGKHSLPPGLLAYANTPMEKAIRICIIEAVRYLSQVIPVTYYKYQDNGKTKTQGQT